MLCKRGTVLPGGHRRDVYREPQRARRPGRAVAAAAAGSSSMTEQEGQQVPLFSFGVIR